MPVLPMALEMLALRRMTPTAFGTLMALEPAFGVLLGLLVLHQQPSLTQFGGITLIVLAGAAAQRGGRRQPRSRELADTRMDPAVIDPDLIGQGPK
jgi:inner membrane transporter RhtA